MYKKVKIITSINKKGIVLKKNIDKKIDQSVIDLYDEYTHKPLERRVFLEKLGKIAGGSAVALSLLPFLENDYLHASIINDNDTRIESSYETYELEGKKIKYYRAVPKSEGKYPAIVLIHENRGLNPHIKDLARRFAVEGFIVIAPDVLSLNGGTPSDEDKARSMIKQLDMDTVLDLYIKGIDTAKEDIRSNGRVATAGFCWGGGLANKLAANCKKLNASVAYYGRQLNTAETVQIDIPIMLHYAGLDKRINAGITDFVMDLLEAEADFTVHYYKGVNHAFNNDTNKARYDKEAAELSWKRTVSFLKESLR